MAIRLFKEASGLNIDLSKFHPYKCIWSSYKFNGQQMGNFFSPLTISYLGVPLEGKPQSKVFWKSVEEKIHKKLNK